MLDRINPRIMLACIVLLAVLVLAGSHKRRKTEEGNFDTHPTQVIDTADVTKVVIWPQVIMGTTNTLTRTENGWTLTREELDYPADQEAVNDMLKALGSIRASRVVSHNPDDWNGYGLGPDVGTRVKVFAGDEQLLDFRLGGLSMFDKDNSDSTMNARFGFDPRFIDTYMRIEGNATVYMADGFFSHNFTRIWDAWIDSAKYVNMYAE